ncbi:MAG: hypothetical protein COA82_04495 [Alkaliphilus sp.]|nr:MAG: hypothetical protein COA82_04495 [Alkaliphilus sp.]
MNSQEKKIQKNRNTKIFSGKRALRWIVELEFLLFKLMLPLLFLLARCFKFRTFSKTSIRKRYIVLNNKLIMSRKYNVKSECILLLLPHCLQKSLCVHRITYDINNCKMCGECDIFELIRIKEKYGLQIYLVTGGTIARKAIIDLKPEVIVAVACERDLISGLGDVEKIPVYAIINDRPKGPCFDTKVDVKEVEKVVQFFLGE